MHWSTCVRLASTHTLCSFAPADPQGPGAPCGPKTKRLSEGQSAEVGGQ